MMDDEEMSKLPWNIKEDVIVNYIVFASGYDVDKKYPYYYYM